MAGRTRRNANIDPVDDGLDFDDQDELEDIDDGGQSYSGDRPRRRILPKILFAVIGLAVIGSLVMILGFNAGGVRDQYIFPPLRGLPLVGQFIPGGDYIEINGEMVEIPADAAELQETLYAIAEQMEALQAELAVAHALNDQHAQTVSVLQVYRDFITEYRQNRQNFDEMIAMGDPNAFATFYEEVNPDNAARLFAQIRANREIDREFRNYARTYAEMNTDEAAEVFSLLLGQNATLLLRILETFNTDQRAAVFNEMENTDVAIITILMEPDTVPADILPPIPVIDGGATPIPVITVADTPVADGDGTEATETEATEAEAAEDEEA